MNKDKKKNQIDWYDNPNMITNFIIGLITLVIILSQSFAINNNLSAVNILGSILNHNSVYLLVFIYFALLKTKIGKKYFDFLNIFLIVLYALEALTSLLTVFQSFALGTILSLAINLILIVYLVHTFLRNTRLWKTINLGKSPFNEITNAGYFYGVVVVSVTLLAVNLISTTSLDGTILALMDSAYIILFARYIFLYREYLDNKNIDSKNEGNFDKYRDLIKNEVNEFVEENKLDEKFDAVKEKINDFTEGVKEKAIELKEEVEEKIEDAKLGEKFDAAKKKVVEVAEDVKEKATDLKEEAEEKIKEAKLDEKFDAAKKKVVEVAEDVKEKATDLKEEAEEKIKEAKLDEKFDAAKKKIVEVAENVKEKATDLKEETENKIKAVKRNKVKNDDIKKDITSRKKNSKSSTTKKKDGKDSK